ncbi:MAG: hypothetical protein E6Q67_05170 [Roseateles sp.]|nr:MAG: hypothetical protein E6Q67_05170 [Roseateles sp.]
MNFENALYLIESDPALQLVQAHITAVRRQHAHNAALAQELGVKEAVTSKLEGHITGVRFTGRVPEGWTAPDRKHRCSRPKKGTEWAARFAAQPRVPNAAQAIAAAFSVPLQISYRKEDGEGFGLLGNPFFPCGFLYLSADGPYAMWVPDVAAAVADFEALGYQVDEQTESFSMDLPGCRRLLKEEWQLMVAQHDLDQAKAGGAR